MKIVCKKSTLLNGVQIVSKAVPSKTTMSILECILIDVRNGEIKLAANDMELGIETRIEGEVIEKGMIALDAKIFLEIVRKLPDSNIKIETDSSLKTTITCEKAKFNIIGKSGEDFSYLPLIERNDSVVVSQFTLKEIIRQTIFSIADNDNNRLMTGELFEIDEDTLKVVSLDGHRISIRKIGLKDTYAPRKIVVPGKTLSEISKILSGDTDKDVNIFFTDNHILFEFDNTIVVSRLIEGEYFRIDQMLSSDYETKVRINKKEFLNCISQFTLKEIIRQTIFSIADNDNNRLMTGELFEIDEDTLKVVSLDGHRISIRKIGLKDTYAPRKIVVPGKTLSEISKILSGDTDKDVNIFFTDNHILFEFDNTIVVSRLIEGEYFRIDQMLSSDYETKVRINKKEFLNCIDRATLLVKEGDKKPVIINITDEAMELKMNTIIGSMDEEIDIVKNGKDLMIGFNPKFLIDALRVIDDEEVDLYMVNPKAPCFIRDEEENYIYLILPVNFTTVS